MAPLAWRPSEGVVPAVAAAMQCRMSSPSVALNGLAVLAAVCRQGDSSSADVQIAVQAVVRVQVPLCLRVCSCGR